MQVLKLLLTLFFSCLCVAQTKIPWYAFNGGGSRSGINDKETQISTSNVATLTLKWKTSLSSVTNTIDSTPVFYPNVALANGSTADLLFYNSLRGTLYAVNADTGKVVWNVTVNVNCGTTDCITKSTPVIDPSGMYIYCYRIDGTVRKYEIGTGKEVTGNGFPVQTTTIPTYEQGSSPLNIINNVLYITTSGDNHDDSWYDGHVLAVNLTSTGDTQIWNSLCANKRYLLKGESDCTISDRNGAGIWSRGSAVEEPLDGSIYVAMGNGAFNVSKSDWADSIVRLRAGLPNASNVMIDSYTPTDQQNMQDKDYDLGSSAPCILPQITQSKTPYMLVQASKDAMLRLINRQNLSGKGCCGNVGGEVHSVSYTDGFVFTHPLAYKDPSGNVWVYVTTTTAASKGTGFHAYQILTDANGASTLSLKYTLSNAGTSPFMANNILFFQVTNAVLALDPSNGKTLWTSSATSGLHWQSPIVINGHVYTADNSGNIYAWGLP